MTTTSLFNALALVVLLTSQTLAEEHRIGPDTDLKKLCQQVKPGDSIVLKNGTWNNVDLAFDSMAGTEDSPISIIAETSGKVIFSGKTTFRFSGQHVIVSGLVFRDCYDVNHVFAMKSKSGELAKHCRVTQCVFEQPTEIESQQNTKWLSVYGSNNRVDHCYFEGKTTLGTTLVVWIGNEPEKHRIDHNFFGPRPELGQNGGETIRIGTSKVSESPCETIVEDNYFYRCNGEAEIISNKSCGNIYRHNVFEECAGALTLRHGHRCLVDGNLFLGNEQAATGGVRVIGQGHRVINNYFEGLRGENVRSAVSLMNGIPNGPINGYAPVEDAIVAHNTFIDCKATFGIGVGAGSRNRTVRPKNCLIANNVISPGKWNPFTVYADPVGFVWEGNKQQSGGDFKSPVKLDRVTLTLKQTDDGLMRPMNPQLLKTKTLSAMEITTDIDGEPRGESSIAGCDDPNTATRTFPSPANTGPDWWRTAKDSGGSIEKSPAANQSHNVTSADDFESLLESGKVSAGDTIVWAAGNYVNAELNIEDIDGTAELPITLRAAKSGAVVFTGESQVRIGSQHWVISGFHFNGQEGKFNSYNTFQFRGNGGKAAQHVRLTDCAFTDLRSEDETSKWVLIYGHSNSIDHCHFSGKNKKGALVTVELGYLGDDDTANHQIFRNYFGDVAPQEGNDNETIRIGSSGDQNKQAQCIVRENLFVSCDGEAEIISSKSSYNTIQQNTFRKCNGAVVLRHGHHARVEGNFFFGDGASNAGGIRIVDSHHTIANNYLQDLTGTTWNAALSILGGNAPSGGTNNGYQAVDDIVVKNNSIINCNRSILLNKAKGKRTPTGIIANNLISSTHEPLVKAELSTAGFQWTDNLMHGASIGAEVDAITDDPMLTEINGLKRQGVSGADEVAGAVDNRMSKPLTAADVGASFSPWRE